MRKYLREIKAGRSVPQCFYDHLKDGELHPLDEFHMYCRKGCARGALIVAMSHARKLIKDDERIVRVMNKGTICYQLVLVCKRYKDP